MYIITIYAQWFHPNYLKMNHVACFIVYTAKYQKEWDDSEICYALWNLRAVKISTSWYENTAEVIIAALARTSTSYTLVYYFIANLLL